MREIGWKFSAAARMQAKALCWMHGRLLMLYWRVQIISGADADDIWCCQAIAIVRVLKRGWIEVSSAVQAHLQPQQII